MKPAKHKLLIHQPEDSVGVVIADIRAGEKITGIVTVNNARVEIEAISDIPLGHKIALKPVGPRESIIIYGNPCGLASQAIARGEHVHVHNMKSARW